MLFSTVRHQAWEPACFLSDHFRSEVWAVGQPGPRTSGTDFDFLLLTSQLHGGLLTFPHMATMLLPLRPETPLEPSSFPVIWLGPVPRPPHYAEASTLLPSHTDRQVPDPPASSLSTHSPWEVPVNVYLCEATSSLMMGGLGSSCAPELTIQWAQSRCSVQSMLNFIYVNIFW